MEGKHAGASRPSLRAVFAVLLVVTGGVALETNGGATAQPASMAHWGASYDPTSQTRFIPAELIIGGDWGGSRELTLPSGRFAESIAAGASIWRGPMQWLHPDTLETLQVYERKRQGVSQKMALRKDGGAIGRVEDSRGDSTCDQEGKFPLGTWRQGETRYFEYDCWFGPAQDRRRRKFISALTIENISFSYNGVPHSLRMRWILKRKEDDREMDNKVYVFSPGRSLVLVR